MYTKKRMLGVLAILFVAVFCFSLTVHASAAGNGKPEEVRVPITLEVPYAIAGAEFEIEYTAGLKLLAFEKSETISTSSTTPVVEKNGKAYFGFYHGSNDYAPVDGVLDVGFLVFEYSGEPGQSVLVTEAKYVQVIDKDNTNGNLLALSEKLDVPVVPGAALHVGKTSYTLWIVLGGALILVAVASVVGVILYRKKKKAGKAPEGDMPEAKIDV